MAETYSAEKDINQFIVDELQKCAAVLESHFHDMVDMEFTVENGVFYLLGARVGRRTAIAALKIAMSMFCEGKMSADDVILSLPHEQIETLLNTYVLVNADELNELSVGLPANKGVGVGRVCSSYNEALLLIEEHQNFIYLVFDCSPEDVYITGSYSCQGVIAARGGMTSHAAIQCRGMDKPCVVGFGDYAGVKCALESYENIATIDGNTGIIYGGVGNIEKLTTAETEFNLLYKLLKIMIKCNAVSLRTAPLVWRLWNLIVLGKRYGGIDNTKRLVSKESKEYVSFSQPTQDDISRLNCNLYACEHAGILIEDFIGFMTSQLSAQVSLGNHYSYVRPLLNPMESIHFIKSDGRWGPVGLQLTGIEFFSVNHFVDCLIDIESVKIYFNTELFTYDEESRKNADYYPLNYLDFTNPKGESLIINSYNAKSISVYINDALIPADDLAMVYHLMRRRTYHWSWHEENNVTRKDIVRYLETKAYLEPIRTKLYYLCEEMRLIDGESLTSVGASLLGRDCFEA